MLVIDPYKRITAKQALKHHYFKQSESMCINPIINSFDLIKTGDSHEYLLRVQQFNRKILESTDSVVVCGKKRIDVSGRKYKKIEEEMEISTKESSTFSRVDSMKKLG